jgi:hypothetical protein
MPKLPSGRNIAIDASPFDDLIEQARTERNAALLMSVRRPRQILPLLQVIEVEERSDIPAEELALVCTPRGQMRCMTYETGLSTSDICNERSGWPKHDISAFRKFLRSRRIKQWVRDRYKQLCVLRDLLGEYARLRSELGQDIRGDFFSTHRGNLWRFKLYNRGRR